MNSLELVASFSDFAELKKYRSPYNGTYFRRCFQDHDSQAIQ